MSTTNPQQEPQNRGQEAHRSRRTSRAIRLLVGVGVVVGSISSVSPAGAAGTSATGTPGGTTFYVVSGTEDPGAAYVSIPGPTVGASNAGTASQRVTVTYRYWKPGSCTTYPRCPDGTPWGSNAWTLVGSSVQSATFSRGQAFRFSGSYYTEEHGGSGPYGVDMVIRWQSSNGTSLGSRTIDYNAAADYACQSPNCKVERVYDGSSAISFNRL